MMGQVGRVQQQVHRAGGFLQRGGQFAPKSGQSGAEGL